MEAEAEVRIGVRGLVDCGYGEVVENELERNELWKNKEGAKFSANDPFAGASRRHKNHDVRGLT